MTLIYTEEDIVQDHVHTITDRELDMIFLKLGSLLSILQNKKTNQAKLLIALVKNKKIRDCFMKIADIDNFQYMVHCLMEKYPTICESKVVSSALKYGKRKKKTYI